MAPAEGSAPDSGALEPDTGTPGPEGEASDLEGTVSWGELAIEVAEALVVGGFEGAESQGRQIVMRACGADTTEWAAMSRELATKRGVAAIDAMTRRRLGGEPLQYVLGEWSFRHLDLFIDRRVLIPRPETEVVAGIALAELHRVAPGHAPVVAADLGTGSGAIGLALVTEHEGVEVWLTDVSDEALAVARANLAGVGWAAARARIAAGSWFEALPSELRGRLGVVVANPPYVADDDELPSEVADWEPPGALFGGPGGTDHVEHLIRQAPAWLQPGGSLVLEMAPAQTQAMAALAATHFEQVDIEPDLAGRDRALLARNPRPT
jgi:release factor glutamine methyltransferase